MKILIGCEESQEVCKAFRIKGHEAYSCDLQECSGGHPEWHLKMDVLQAVHRLNLRTQLNQSVNIDYWDAAIFFPDCTFLTCSAEWAYKEQPPLKSGALVGIARQIARAKAVEFFLNLWHCGIMRIAIENPIGVMSSELRQPDQIIQPNKFGHDANKATCLWLHGFPCLTSTEYIKPRMVCSKCKTVFGAEKTACPKCNISASYALRRWGNQTDSGQNRLPPDTRHNAGLRAKLRSKTYPGIADAMASQWG